MTASVEMTSAHRFRAVLMKDEIYCGHRQQIVCDVKQIGGMDAIADSDISQKQPEECAGCQ